jgi:hypothetical protein
MFTHSASAVAVLLLIATTSTGEVMQLNVPNSPPSGTQTLNGSFQGYSMEMASFPDIAGNLS